MKISLHRFFLKLMPVYFLAAFTSCSQPIERKKVLNPDSIPKKDISIHGYFSEQQVLHTDSGQLKSFFRKFPLLNNYADEVTRFYSYRNDRFAWYDSSRLVEQASNLYNHLNNLELEGIQVPVPYKNVLDSILNEPVAEQGPDPVAEILLTAEYFFYADKVWNGIPEETSTKLEWYLPRKKLNLPFMMDSLLKDTTASIFSGNYNYRQYKLLREELWKYRHLDSTSLWNKINPGSRVFKKSDTSAIIQAVRNRLYLLGDMHDDSGSNLLDDSLVNAVKSFQDRNGMIPDGVMGTGFFREINIPLEKKIRTLIINMERTRWVPENLSEHYLIINIPAFTLYAYDKDTLTFKMNVVVGKNLNKTMIFNGDIKYIVFSPYWNVPPSILKKEIIPAIRRNPDYLNKNNMEWNGNSVRQKPGPSNSLGLVKFLFPNTYNIYLHDSPAKSLFGAQSRAFSHGCIRVSDAKKLAAYLLKDDPQWDEEKITKAMNAGKEKWVTLAHPIPVYIGYLTAWVGNDGKLNFRKDIYNRDLPLEEMLIQK